jgi:hypothetical protein
MLRRDGYLLLLVATPKMRNPPFTAAPSALESGIRPIQWHAKHRKPESVAAA